VARSHMGLRNFHEPSTISTTAEPTISKQLAKESQQPLGRYGENIQVNDTVRTNSHRGIVESIEYYRPFGELTVYFRTKDNQLLRTPVRNTMKIPL